MQTLYHTYKRYRTLQTDIISAMPIVILMPHSACNCRCVMCDIWKDNKNLKQLNESDITRLLASLKKLGTQQVVMSGGEALLNKNFFKLCELLKKEKISVSLLSTGLTLKHHAEQILKWVNDVIVSIDGDEALHDAIRNIPGAFNKLREGVAAIKAINPNYKITGRCVIHRLNFRNWENIISEAKNIGLNQISFLPADVSSEAFNRQTAWTEPKQHEILISETELPELQAIIDRIITTNYKNAAARAIPLLRGVEGCVPRIAGRITPPAATPPTAHPSREGNLKDSFIAESAEKIQHIYNYYAAFYNIGAFPYKKCNAPWVSTVVEADGSVRPCFFHGVIGNIHDNSLTAILNSDEAINFRKTLDMEHNEICVKCVCSLNLNPRTHLN